VHRIKKEGDGTVHEEKGKGEGRVEIKVKVSLK
jgi:hypothetical protein